MIFSALNEALAEMKLDQYKFCVRSSGANGQQILQTVQASRNGGIKEKTDDLFVASSLRVACTVEKIGVY